MMSINMLLSTRRKLSCLINFLSCFHIGTYLIYFVFVMLYISITIFAVRYYLSFLCKHSICLTVADLLMKKFS